MATIPVPRPKPFQVGPVRVRAIRGPRDDGSWYFRAERYRDNTSETVWTGWATVERVTRILAGLVADDRLDEALASRGEHLDTVKDLLEVWLAGQVGRVRRRSNVPPAAVRCGRPQWPAALLWRTGPWQDRGQSAIIAA